MRERPAACERRAGGCYGRAPILAAMSHFAVSVVGRDRPGIVAALAGAVLDHGANIEDSQMTILRGHFAMTLILAAPPEMDPEALRADLEGIAGRLELDAVSLSAASEVEAAGSPAASHVVTVYGADHPGIVHAVASALAGRGVNITDLSTRLVGDSEGAPLYAMILEVAPPPEVGLAELEELLGRVGGDQGVEVSARPLEHDTL